MKEIWKDIPWFEWYYEASTLWNIRSIERVLEVKSRWGCLVKRIKKSIVLNSYDNGRWYMYVDFCVNNQYKRIYVHVLVASTFLENPKATVNHKNWIRYDNRLENLEWATYSENHRHKFDVLWYTAPTWRNNKSSKKVIQYSLNWDFIKKWYCIKDIERELNIFATSISACCKWKSKTCWWFKWEYY